MWVHKMNKPRDLHAPSFQRRACLQAGCLGLAGLGLGDLLRLRANASRTASLASETSCILVWLGGGPSHLETYDPKPAAPAEYRGEFGAIPTRTPGLNVCELLPRHAQLADRYSVIRSCTHGFSGHWDGSQHVLTGWPAVLTGGGTPTSVYPEVGAVFKRIRPQNPAGLPNYVAISHPLGAVGPAYLGQSYQPFLAAGNPNHPDFKIPNLSLAADGMRRLDDRRLLRQAFDHLRRDLDHGGLMHAMDRHDHEALRLLTSRATERAFDIGRADPRERERYGRTTAGQTLLLARRLVESGVGFVTAEVSNFQETGFEGGWDDHAGGCNLFDRMRRRLPVYDQAVSALIDDLYQRGLDRRVLVLVLGEFGRTPYVVVKDGLPGREHWPAAMSILVAGGGLRMGQVIGCTDSKGERPKDRALSPADLLATAYRFLGIDPSLSFRDHRGRPIAILPEGAPIAELF